jgi:hypothetical protein
MLFFRLVWVKEINKKQTKQENAEEFFSFFFSDLKCRRS